MIDVTSIIICDDGYDGYVISTISCDGNDNNNNDNDNDNESNYFHCACILDNMSFFMFLRLIILE